MFNNGRVRVFALLLADIICVCLVWSLVVWGYWTIGRSLEAMGVATSIGGYNPSVYLSFWPVPLFFVLINILFDLYHGNWLYPSAPLSPVEEMRRLVGSSFLTHIGVIAFLGFAYQSTEGFSRVVIAFSGGVSALLAQSFRNWIRWILYRLNIGYINALLVGTGDVAEKIAAILVNDPYSGIRIVGYFADKSGKFEERKQFFEGIGIQHLGTLRDIIPEAKKRDIRVLLACQEERVFRTQLKELSSWFTYIEYLPTTKAFPIHGARTISFGGCGGLEMVNQGQMKLKRLQKYFLDKILSFIAFFILLPFFFFLPILIKLTSRGPVFFRQKRLGMNGKTIYVWKFRSMYVDAEERLQELIASNSSTAKEWLESFKLRKDPRVTPLGKFLRKTSLDEIPQLFNVFCGEMSLIGPRPIVEKEVAYYGDSYNVFSSVKPGITGLWQVSGRSDTNYTQRVALDTYYVLNWSPWMDLWILVRTVYAVLFMRGAR